MKRETLKETADILHHILNQPLTIPGLVNNVSLLEAAKNFKQEDYQSSDLHNLLTAFHNFPGPTQTLITELEILIQELHQK